MDIKNFLDSLYNDGAKTGTLEKTAEEQLLATLRGEGDAEETPAAEDPFEGMSDEELLKLAEELEAAEGPGEGEAQADDEVEKTAAEMLGGQIMAHAMVHEMSLIKEAMASGKCRVCKTNKMDVPGKSVCSKCAKG